MAELLVVIIIIGILASIAIPVYLNQKQRSRDVAITSDVKSLAIAAETLLITQPNADWYQLRIEGNKAVLEIRTLVNGAPISQESMPVSLTSGTNIAIVTAHGNKAGAFKIYAYNEQGKNYTSKTAFLMYDSQDGGLKGLTASSYPTTTEATWLKVL